MKRFNFTGRKKIFLQDIVVRLQGDLGAKPVINVTMDLKDYDFPTDAIVYLESQSKTRFKRIHLGEATDHIESKELELKEFDDSEGLKFRVKILEKDNGMILGFAENIKAFDKDNKPDDSQHGILPVRSTDLTKYGVLWRIGFADQEAILEIEKDLGGREQVVRSLLFKGFILPAAMREILTKIVSDDWDDSLSDTQELSTRWFLFTKKIGAGVPERNVEDHEEWLDNTVRLLANKLGVRQQIVDDYDSGVWK